MMFYDPRRLYYPIPIGLFKDKVYMSILMMHFLLVNNASLLLLIHMVLNLLRQGQRIYVVDVMLLAIIY